MQAAVAGDTVQYSVYSLDDDKISVTAFGALINDYVTSIIPHEFLWHRDPWNLHLTDIPSKSGSYFLEGHVRIGDCLDDEWAIVWLLKSISIHWPELSISVYDQDGAFLLIEAANCLPKWVTPANSDNRVWIHNGQIHLIPLEYHSPASSQNQRKKRTLPGQEDHSWLLQTDDLQDEWITEQHALQYVRSPNSQTQAPAVVENVIWARADRYPEAFLTHIHHAIAYLHSDVAKALTIRPALVQRAAEMFYTRDATHLRSANRMSRFSPTNFVLASVPMTRLAYAQLSGQKFFPPRIFGRWEGNVETREWKQRDIGMKITVGFEMLFQDTKNQVRNLSSNPEAASATVSASLDSLRRTTPYQEYIKNLVTRTSYFRGSVEGSQLWQELEKKAVVTFLEITNDSHSQNNFAFQVTEAIAQCSVDVTARSELREDSDEWLNVVPENLQPFVPDNDEAMNVDHPGQRQNKEDQEIHETADRMQNFAEQVESFVGKEGNIDGAIVTSDDDSDDSDDSDMGDSDSEEDQDVDMDMEQSKQDVLASLVPPLPQGEYGTMPSSFYERSQKVADPPLEDDKPSPTFQSQEGEVEDKKTKERFEKLRRPIFVRDAFDGVDSDDESSVGSEDFGIDPLNRGDSDGESEDDRPQVEEQDNELEVDMGQEEEEFLEFSRTALGIDDEHWAKILSERQDRGAYVPANFPIKPSGQNKKPQRPSEKLADSSPREELNPPDLDSFEAVMQAMDNELSRVQKEKGTSGSKGKGKGKAMDVDEGRQEDVEVEMDEELRKILDKGDGEEGTELGSDTSINYNLIKNFLESYGAEGGQSGPVGGLMAMMQNGKKGP